MVVQEILREILHHLLVLLRRFCLSEDVGFFVLVCYVFMLWSQRLEPASQRNCSEGVLDSNSSHGFIIRIELRPVECVPVLQLMNTFLNQNLLQLFLKLCLLFNFVYYDFVLLQLLLQLLEVAIKLVLKGEPQGLRTYCWRKVKLVFGCGCCRGDVIRAVLVDLRLLVLFRS